MCIKIAQLHTMHNNAKRWSFLGIVFFRSKGYLKEDQEGIVMELLGKISTWFETTNSYYKIEAYLFAIP